MKVKQSSHKSLKFANLQSLIKKAFLFINKLLYVENKDIQTLSYPKLQKDIVCIRHNTVSTINANDYKTILKSLDQIILVSVI